LWTQLKLLLLTTGGSYSTTKYTALSFLPRNLFEQVDVVFFFSFSSSSSPSLLMN